MEDEELNPYRPPQVSSVLAEPRGKYRFTREPHRLTKLLVVILWILVVLDVGWFIAGVGQVVGFMDVFGRRPIVVALDNVTRFLNFLSFVVFPMWVYRAGLNAHGFGAAGMQVTAGWAIGWYFVPIAAFYKPYQAMKEIWQVCLNPEDWRSQKVPRLIVLWWALWIVPLTVYASFAVFSAESSSVSWSMFLVMHITSIALGCVVIRLVQSITAAQDRLVNRPVAE